MYFAGLDSQSQQAQNQKKEEIDQLNLQIEKLSDDDVVHPTTTTTTTTNGFAFIEFNQFKVRQLLIECGKYTKVFKFASHKIHHLEFEEEEISE